jgi:hypothetical protein
VAWIGPCRNTAVTGNMLGDDSDLTLTEASPPFELLPHAKSGGSTGKSSIDIVVECRNGTIKVPRDLLEKRYVVGQSDYQENITY